MSLCIDFCDSVYIFGWSKYYVLKFIQRKSLMSNFYNASIDHYKAKRSEALATLELYFNNSVGIGEHSDLLLEIRKWTEILDNANSALETLSNDFSVTGDQVQVRNVDQQVARSVL